MVFSSMSLCTESLHHGQITKRTATTPGLCESEERALVKWCNYHLTQRDCQIRTLSDLEDGVFLIGLLELLAEQIVTDIGCGQQRQHADSISELNWKTISSFLGSEANIDLGK